MQTSPSSKFILRRKIRTFVCNRTARLRVDDGDIHRRIARIIVGGVLSKKPGVAIVRSLL